MSLFASTGPESDQPVRNGPLADHLGRTHGSPLKVLVLEDDRPCSDVLCELLEHEGAEPHACGTLADAKRAVAHGDFDFYILDSKLPDGNGAEFYYYLVEKEGMVTAIMLTGLPDLSTAVELTKTGLLNYLTKPYSVAQLRGCLAQAIAHRQRRAPKRDRFFSSLSESMQLVYKMVRQAAANPGATVLVTGETGVGKDVLARAVHRLAEKHDGRKKPFVNLNCATLPADMFEAELFGAERGAYTGAIQSRDGLVESAEDGTLFLDEIAEVPIQLQAKLLHLLECGEFRRLGSPVSKRFAGRIIAATNRPLGLEVQEGRFRADLLYRLDIFSVEVPPLRARMADLPVLCDEILTELSGRTGRIRPQIKYEDLQLLQGYAFPGNIRELRNFLERSLMSTPITCAWLQIDPLTRARLQAPPPAPAKRTPAPAPALPPLEASEYEMVREALAAERGAIRRAAARLGMSHQSLLRRLKKWPHLRSETPWA